MAVVVVEKEEGVGQGGQETIGLRIRGFRKAFLKEVERL